MSILNLLYKTSSLLYFKIISCFIDFISKLAEKQSMLEASELILNLDGSVYHLGIKPKDIAEKIILVGDPERVKKVAKNFKKIHFEKENREFHTITGTYKNQKITVLSTGIGTDNIDIVLNELEVLANLDFKKKKWKPKSKSLKILRLGTTGGVQENFPVGSIIASAYALDLGNLHLFYEFQRSIKERELTLKFHYYFDEKYPKIETQFVWAFEAHPNFIHLAQKMEIPLGITCTACGFYGPQGRNLGRIPLKYPNLPLKLKDFQFEDYKITNFEMETAGIYMLGKALGHHVGSLSVILANRSLNQFSDNPDKEVEKLIQVGLKMTLAF